MNVLICVSKLSYAMGGVSTHIIDLCKQYSRMDNIEKIVLCCDGGECIETLKQVPEVSYFEVPFDRPKKRVINVLKSYKTLWKIVRDQHIDIIHVHSQRLLPLAFLIKLFHHIPFVWTNHIDAIPNPKLMKLMCFFMRFPIISVSQELRNIMISDYKCNPQKVYVVNNGTDLETLTPLTKEEKETLELQWGIDRNKTPYVISLLGRVRPVKGHKLLLQAIAKIPEKEKIQVIFAGHTYPNAVEYRTEVEQLARENSIPLIFLDYSKPRDVFGVSDLFVSPSFFEGFPLVCIEALAMECAVIRSRTPGWQELEPWIEIVEKGDVQGLSESIHKTIQNNFNREKTVEGHKNVLQLFTKEECGKNTVAVYEKILLNCKKYRAKEQ